ncbi:NAD(P)-dependent dehydrogenase (short-subunit alcohol dehydrogenase family) [Kribbella steppae]|uniref:NAD(P)-dependent dehydrogenase (Short-subunit alcohol dehydrogenase family) n=2 Tax=Kribbella steppae TaxID=2512223 RepID=A0A4R2HQ14_9ACTN|nr:NAD(P)-dependent dehydrogenase (short-subunit alcohol dehydrogenase family) [Kribbella steppae]
MLTGKHAIVYGAAGPIGSAVAKSFAVEGAIVHLAGRTQKTLDQVADEIRAAGGQAETGVVDALDEKSVDEHAEKVGRIDISFNLIGHTQFFGTPLVEMSLEDFELPVATALRTFYLTSRAAARQMIKQGSGVILTFGGYGDPMANLGGFQVGFGAVEALRRSLACELGPHGIRVLTLQTAGIPESNPDTYPEDLRRALEKDTAARTMLKRAATLSDVGAVAVFAASDQARALTGTALNLTVGAVVN